MDHLRLEKKNQCTNKHGGNTKILQASIKKQENQN